MDDLEGSAGAGETGDDFFVANMIPTCIDNDEAAAMAVNRRTLTNYAYLVNYRNYWSEDGFEARGPAAEHAERAAATTEGADA